MAGSGAVLSQRCRPHSLGKRHAVAVRHVDVADDQSNLFSKFLDDPKTCSPSPASTVWKCSLCRMALIYFRTAGSSSTTSEMRPMPVWTANRYEKVPKNWLDQLTQKGHVANRIENPKPSQNAPNFLTAATTLADVATDSPQYAAAEGWTIPGDGDTPTAPALLQLS